MNHIAGGRPTGHLPKLVEKQGRIPESSVSGLGARMVADCSKTWDQMDRRGFLKSLAGAGLVSAGLQGASALANRTGEDMTENRVAGGKTDPKLGGAPPSGAPGDGFSSAQWIWAEGKPGPYFQVCLFRCAVSLDAVPAGPVRLLCGADSKYHLWVNGSYVNTGPARSHPSHPYYDTHEITGLLHPGRNIIAFRVQSYTKVDKIFCGSPRRPDLPNRNARQSAGRDGPRLEGCGFTSLSGPAGPVVRRGLRRSP